MNYYRRYMGDYAKKTAALSLAEHGAYTLLLDELYSTERPLPGDYESLFRLCRAMTKAEQDAVRSVADRFFPVGSDGFRTNQRASEEIAIAQPAIEASRTNGVKGGRPRKNPAGFHEQTKIEPTRGQPPTPNPQPPSTNPQKKYKGRAFALPDWIPAESWEAWMEVRKKLRAPNTDRALRLAVGDLEKFRADGHDPASVLDNATKRGWRGLFPPSNSGSTPDYSSLVATLKD